jgi:hypothetical protein
MNTLTQKLRSSTLNLALYYLNRDPEKNIPKIIDMVLPFTHRDNIRNQLIMGKAIMQDVNNPYRGLILRVLEGIAPKVRRCFVSNFVFNSAILGQNKALVLKQKYKMQHPLGDFDGSHKRLQPAVQRMLGCRIR